MTLTIGSLFSGIGGLELGLEWAGLGPVLWQVEINEACRGVLARHWPEVRRYEDVRRATALAPVDLICGGFPCQDLSSAGKRAGLAGARSGLWAEFVRVIAEVRSRWVVVENVRSGARNWIDAVRGDLGKLGYASLPVPIAAGDLGAPHERARVFVIACRPAYGDDEERQADAETLRRPNITSAEPPRAHAASSYADGAIVRLEHRWVGRTHRNEARQSQGALANANAQGEPQPRWPEREVGRWTCDADRIWTAEPDVARVVHGVPGRVDRERALGNAVVPQCAEVIGYLIRKLREDCP